MKRETTVYHVGGISSNKPSWNKQTAEAIIQCNLAASTRRTTARGKQEEWGGKRATAKGQCDGQINLHNSSVVAKRRKSSGRLEQQAGAGFGGRGAAQGGVLIFMGAA